MITRRQFIKKSIGAVVAGYVAALVPAKLFAKPMVEGKLGIIDGFTFRNTTTAEVWAKKWYDEAKQKSIFHQFLTPTDKGRQVLLDYGVDIPNIRQFDF